MIKLTNIINIKRLVEQNEQYKIYCDMDGVLSDFERMVYETLGVTVDEFRKKHPENVSPGEPDDVLMWKTIDKNGGLNFWSHMFWMPDGKVLWEFLKNKNVEILSAPTRTIPEHSALGKKLWCNRFLGRNIILNLARATEKQKFAEPNHILIDDMESNIQRWKSAGGIGILHTSASDTIQKLKALGIE